MAKKLSSCSKYNKTILIVDDHDCRVPIKEMKSL